MRLAYRHVRHGNSYSTAISVRSFASATSDLSRRQLWRWGAAQTSKMGGPDVPEISEKPQLMKEVHGVAAIACGSSHSGYVVGGKLMTYGSNKHGQLGREAAEAEALMPGETHIEASDGHCPAVLRLAMGAHHTAAITEGGALWTWGYGGSFWYGAGGLGQGSRNSVGTPQLVQKFVEFGEEIEQVACGAQHTIVLTHQGRIYTTGKGDFGRLGRGDPRDELDFEEVEYFSLSNDSVLNPSQATTIIKVDAGQNFTAALSRDGELWVWGRNDYGQLGLGEEAMGDMYSSSRYPRLVRSLPVEGQSVADFVCGEHHVVALTTAGALYEWGNRLWLEPHPVTLPSRYEEGLKGIIKVAAGERCSFALTRDGRLYSWGAKSSGCLALGENCPKNVLEPTLVPPEVFDHQRIIDIAVSKNRCLAITEEGEFTA